MKLRKNLMIYVHIPFCKRKCNYCDFLSFSCGNDTKWSLYIDKYIKALETDVIGKIPDEDVIDPDDYIVSSIFIGGGTPSYIAPSYIVSVLDIIRSKYLVLPDAEITIEANPGTLDYDKLSAYRQAGINRLSMGVQAFDDRELRILGRIHDRQTAIDNFNEARRAGFDNINLDLISAVPGQSVESWVETLKTAIELNPEHISAYSLIIEQGTPFGDYYLNNSPKYDFNETGKNCSIDDMLKDCVSYNINSDKPSLFPELPDEDSERKMYEITAEILGGAGYRRYEISNYAKPGFCSRHNTGYWTGREYLGLGLGASSYISSLKNPGSFIRFNTTSDPDQFLKAPCHRDLIEIIGPQKAMEEFMFLGLRMTSGVSVIDFERRFNRNIEEVYGKIINKYTELGMLVREEDRIRLSDMGISVSNVIMADFIL